MTARTIDGIMPVETGSNLMELVDFRLVIDGKQELFGINVSKVVEIMFLPKNIVTVPDSNPAQMGIVSVRGRAVPVFDMGAFLDVPGALEIRKWPDPVLIVTEFSRLVLGFAVHHVERIRRFPWNEIVPVNGLLSSGRGSRRVVGTAIIRGDRGSSEEDILQVVDLEAVASDLGFFDRQVDDVETEAASPANGKTVLLADDSATVRNTVEKALMKAGFAVVSTSDGEEALEALKKNRIDLVVSDVEMPRMDGYSLAKLIRRDPERSGIPIILNSSMSGSANIQKGKEAGADDYIVKFSPRLVVEAVRRILKEGGKS